MKVSKIRGSRLLIVAIATMLTQVAVAQDISGRWGSAMYEVEFTVTGATVSGTFTSLLAPDRAAGTISGTLQQDRKIFQAEWMQPMGAGHGGFNTLLALDKEGRVLVGYRWNEGGYPTSFALHRAENGEIPRLVEVDEAEKPPLAATPQTPAAPAGGQTGPPTPAAPTHAGAGDAGERGDFGGVSLGTGLEGGRATGVANHFDRTDAVVAVLDYTNIPRGSSAVVNWTRDDEQVARDEKDVEGNGSVAFGVRTRDEAGMKPGRYTVTITVGETVLGRKSFTIGTPGQVAAGPTNGPNINEAPMGETPVTLDDYRDKVGQTLRFRVTGSTTGSIWGTGIYTDDSPLAVAAVHAGLVRPGQEKVIAVEILRGQDKYTGTSANGIDSLDYESWGGSYRFITGQAPAATVSPAPAPVAAGAATIDALVGEWSVIMSMLDGPQPTTLTVKRDGNGVVGTLDDRINAYLRLKASGDGNNYEGTWTDPQAGTVAVRARITPNDALIVSLVKGNGGTSILLGAGDRRAEAGTGQAPAPTARPAHGSVPNLTGDWAINANNHRGTLSLQREGNRLTGSILGNPLAEGAVLADGTVRFIRTGPNQSYTGTFSVEPDGTWKLSGTLDCPVTRTKGSLWVATRNPSGGQTPSPALPKR